MKIFFYCSYEHSQKGFFMTQVEGNTLIPAKNIPCEVSEFFSYDRYQVLWRDLPSAKGWSRRSRETEGSFLGIRNISGRNIENRKFVVNFCIIASKEEENRLRKAALTILGDYVKFEMQMLSWLKVGGECSYELNFTAFSKWLEDCSSNNQLVPVKMERSAFKKLLPLLTRSKAPSSEKELLRLAVYTSSRDDIIKLMGDKRIWRSRLENLIGTSEFSTLFKDNSPLWEIK